jgi:hypothetical protein
MQKTSLCAAVALALATTVTTAAATDQTDAFAAVKKFDDGINKGDSKAALSMCIDQAIVIDDFAPHVWSGGQGCGPWLSALGAYEKTNGITDDNVALGKPWHITVTGDRGYVVVPVKYSYKQNGKPVVESGSVWTIALQKLAAGWRITGWAWAQH